MNHAIQFQTNNQTSPHQIFMQNVSLARIATITEQMPNTNIPLYLYNQPINNFNQNTQLYTNKQIYACTYCEKKYLLKKRFETHIKTKHGEEKPYITHTNKQIYACSYCEKKYALKNSLDVHIKTKHREKRVRLNEYIQIHTREKSYTCEFCDKKCTSASFVEHVKKCYKKTHLQSCKDADSLLNISEILHSSHQEPLDDALFIKTDNFYIYIETHTEKKTYRCEICDKKCTSASFVEHVKKCYKKTHLQSCKDADSLLNISEILYSPHQEPLDDALSFLQSCENADSLLPTIEILHSPHQEPLDDALFSTWIENI